ncbi:MULTISPECIES: acyl-CoA carboxylase subunit epsilon [unclassified Streptomyces]|uniref:acyl-CoA carboxylase subunit epsilon n=1 Tax=unclassified Streptomyces TaxID=2593676 RepID=UPI0004C5805B|nr:acyl-CoA carboxylase subunit epsilon [Streptomyces sp. NRRL F-5135]
MSDTTDTSLLRVEKGQAGPEELAAITAVLMARAAAVPAAAPGAVHRGRSTAGWRRLERTPGFRAPHSWQG